MTDPPRPNAAIWVKYRGRHLCTGLQSVYETMSQLPPSNYIGFPLRTNTVTNLFRPTGPSLRQRQSYIIHFNINTASFPQTVLRSASNLDLFLTRSRIKTLSHSVILPPRPQTRKPSCRRQTHATRKHAKTFDVLTTLSVVYKVLYHTILHQLYLFL